MCPYILVDLAHFCAPGVLTTTFINANVFLPFSSDGATASRRDGAYRRTEQAGARAHAHARTRTGADARRASVTSKRQRSQSEAEERANRGVTRDRGCSRVRTHALASVGQRFSIKISPTRAYARFARAYVPHFPENGESLTGRKNARAREVVRVESAEMKQQTTYAKESKNAQVREEARIERIFARAVAVALAGANQTVEKVQVAQTRKSAKGGKQRAKKAKRAERKSANRAMAAGIRAHSASAKDVKRFVAEKGEATRETWAKLAEQNGYRV